MGKQYPDVADVERYNVGKKPCRKIQDYMEHVRSSKNGEKVFYETIVQIGNRETCATLSENGELAKQILDEYMKSFQSRNPNLYVFNAVLHLDELTPHLHIDWIPVAREYKQGLQVRNSLDKALKQQGIDGKSARWENSTLMWQEAEKKAVEQVMERHGWERAPETGLKLPHLQIDVYKAQEQLKELQKEIDIAETVADNYFELKSIHEDEAQRAQEAVLEARESLSAVKAEVSTLEAQKTSLEGDLAVLRGQKESLQEEIEIMDRAVKKKEDAGAERFSWGNWQTMKQEAKAERENEKRLKLYDRVMEMFPDVAALVRQCMEHLERGKGRKKHLEHGE